MPPPKTPLVTVDCIIQLPGDRVVLVRRSHPPLGWALPGGFVEVGEMLHQAAVREAQEETGLGVDLSEQFFTYSDPARDPRGHTVSTVFIGWAEGDPRGGDDAADARWFTRKQLRSLRFAFDHGKIVRELLGRKRR